MGTGSGAVTTSQGASFDFVISRSETDDHYNVWRFHPEGPELLTAKVLDPGARCNPKEKLAPIGGYVMGWGPFDGEGASYPFRLFEFDPSSPDPLSKGSTGGCEGAWSKQKYWGSHRSRYSDFPNEGEILELYPLTSFVMSLIPGQGRGTFELWNFDPEGTAKYGSGPDPLPAPYNSQEAFPGIQSGHTLIPMGDYVLDRMPEEGRYRVWSFDPQSPVPLPWPPVQEGIWETIDASHRLVGIGDYVLDFVPGQLDYRLWKFDPRSANPLCGPVKSGTLPEVLATQTNLTAVQPTIPVQVSLQETPGTIDFMRSRIKKVVYYMLESRSFDNALGWLYEKDPEGIHFVGSDEPFKGVTGDMFNMHEDRKVALSKFQDGVLSEDWDLNSPTEDPFHGNPDTLEQMFYERNPGYPGRATPDMGGFCRTAVSDEVMQTLSPEQLPILNGLAKAFAVSDEWFSSIPGGTAINRAFSVTGSSFNKLNTWEGGNPYEDWPRSPWRQSLWKVLWSNGIKDWRIYNAIEWQKYVYTYHLYVEGQVPTVDANVKDYVAPLDQFMKEAREGSLPAFSFLEPVWYAPKGTTSYHPGLDLVPGEVALNEIYQALREGPDWEETLLIVTFDKPGGMFDHVPPPYARKPWPHDMNDRFEYDLMGPRVPTVMVSPLIKEKTVIRSGGPVPFDATSFPATLLSWFGIPKARWGLGDRIQEAPTFETVLSKTQPGLMAPVLAPPYDKTYPAK